MENNVRINYLDGLRGWAALVVCLYHIVTAFGIYSDSVQNSPQFFESILPKTSLAGIISVRIFFILSGIALSISFIKKPAFKKVAALVIKRIPRLSIPIFAMSLIVHFLMKLNLMFNLKAKEIINERWLDVYNFNSTIFKVLKDSFFLVFWGEGTSYNGALWTIKYEFGGSLFVALVLFFAIINKNKKIILFAILVALYYALYYQKHYFGGTLICFLFGILIAYYIVLKSKCNPPSPYSMLYKISFAAIILWFLYNNASLDIKIILVPILIVFLVIITPYLQKIMSTKLSVFLGKISFPLYLIHMPIIFSLTSFLITKKYDPNNTILILTYFVITIAVSITVAYILYPVEKFAIFFSHKVFEYIYRFAMIIIFNFQKLKNKYFYN
jgi:peptidoglycan/LPS O-acetylase OafA/YrhL